MHQNEALEIAASVLTLFSVILHSRLNIWNWVLGMAGSVLFFIVFYRTPLYANMALQVVNFTVQFYGLVSYCVTQRRTQEEVEERLLHHPTDPLPPQIRTIQSVEPLDGLIGKDKENGKGSIDTHTRPLTKHYSSTKQHSSRHSSKHSNSRKHPRPHKHDKPPSAPTQQGASTTPHKSANGNGLKYQMLNPTVNIVIQPDSGKDYGGIPPEGVAGGKAVVVQSPSQLAFVNKSVRALKKAEEKTGLKAQLGHYFGFGSIATSSICAEILVNRLHVWGWLATIISTAILTFGPGYALQHYTKEAWAIEDSAVAAFNIIALVLLGMRYAETWIAWLLMNCAGVALFILHKLYFTAGLFVLLVFATLYGMWGMWRPRIRASSLQGQEQEHEHEHEDGPEHEHEHGQEVADHGSDSSPLLVSESPSDLDDELAVAN